MAITPNRRYWNIMKGIGIVSVVMGHACSWAHDFVYLYHLPLFYFISGFLYSEEKYGDHPLHNFRNRLRSLWGKYVCIYAVLIVFHNLLVRWRLLPYDFEYYSLRETLLRLVLILFGIDDKLTGGPLWFVPTLILSSSILGFTVSLSRLVEKKTGRPAGKFILQAVIVIVLAVLGWIFRSERMPANIQVVLSVMPFQWVGYLLRNYGGSILNTLPAESHDAGKLQVSSHVLKYDLTEGSGQTTNVHRLTQTPEPESGQVKQPDQIRKSPQATNTEYKRKSSLTIVYILLLTITTLILCIISRHTTPDLLAGRYFHGMYAAAFLGILWSAILAACISDLKPGAALTAMLGRDSFWIMAFHAPIMKLLDKCIALYIGDPDYAIYMRLPHSFDDMWPLYLLLGIGLPVLGCRIYEHFRQKAHPFPAG